MRFEMIENFSVTFSSLKFSSCTAAIISSPTPSKWLCNFALYFSCRKSAGGTTEFLFAPTLIQRKKPYRLQPEISVFYFPLTFSAEKPYGWLPEKRRIYKMFKKYGVTKSRQRTVKTLCLLQYIFSKQKQDPAIPFPTVFCYGSNSGVGSYTSVISRAANRKPTANACNSCRSETSASAFSSCSSRAFCCSVRVALSSVSSYTTVSRNSPLSVPLDTVCSCGSILP